MKGAIVTGANGFVGSAVIKELLAHDIEVCAVVHRNHRDNLPEHPALSVVSCDLDKLPALTEKIEKDRYDTFYHFAWAGSAGPARADTRLQLDNAQWAVDALRAAKELGCGRFLCAGSIMEHETMAAACAPGNRPGLGYIYGGGKLAAHIMCMSVAAQLGIDVVWPEVTNAYGPGERSPRLVNSTIQKCIRDEAPQFTAGTQNYDFVYIDDVARAFRLIGEKGKPFHEYLIGSSGARPLKDFLLEMRAAIAPDLPFKFGDLPFTGVDLPIESFDCSQTEADTGFRAEVSFAEGCRRTCAWWRKQAPARSAAVIVRPPVKPCIVTGASGFIGNALMEELAANHVPAVAVVRNENSDVSRLEKLENVRIVRCEMAELDRLPEMIDQKPEVFFHLAWEGSAGARRADYALQLENVRGSLDAVRAAAALGCRRFVGIGTLAEKDVMAYVPLDGSTPNDVSCYGSAKISSHLMTKAECCRLGLEHIWAQLSNTYGEGNYSSNFVNFASKLMLTGQPANFTPGEQMYDFVHIRDTALGLYRAGQFGRSMKSYYIGSTRPRKLKEFIIILRDAIDPQIPLHFGAVPFNGVAHPASVFDCSSLVGDTGYMPRVSFEEGVKETVRWLRAQIAAGRI